MLVCFFLEVAFCVLYCVYCLLAFLLVASNSLLMHWSAYCFRTCLFTQHVTSCLAAPVCLFFFCPSPPPLPPQYHTLLHTSHITLRWVYTPKGERAAGLVEGMKAIVAEKLRAKSLALQQQQQQQKQRAAQLPAAQQQQLGAGGGGGSSSNNQSKPPVRVVRT